MSEPYHEEVPQLELSDRAEQIRPSVESAEQAIAICRRISNDNDERVQEAARIRAKFDGVEPPFSPHKLKEEGKEYKSNIPTGFLSTIANMVINRIVMRLKRTQYLSGSSLPHNVENSVEKSEAFKRHFTQLMRSWRGFPFFVSKLALETVLFGKTFVGFDGPGQWKPRVYRLDDCSIPNGVEQGDLPPFVRLRKVYQVNDLFDFIRDKDAAEAAGWDIDNVIEAINQAQPVRDDDHRDAQTRSLTYEDMERQLISSYAYTHGSNSVVIETLYVEESDGTVSVWMVSDKTEDELFHATNVFNSMDDALQYMCYEIGDGTVYGSNGVGQKVYDLAVNVEKSRNYSVDQLRAAGKFNIQVPDSANANAEILHITDEANFLTGAIFSGNTAALPSNADAYIVQDRYFKGLAEEKIGAFAPENQSTDKTATQSQIDALKEQETRDSLIDTFLTFFGHSIAMVQRRVASFELTDPLVVKFQELCLAEMSVEEFVMLANMPPAQTTIDFTDMIQAKQSNYLQTKIGNPQWNQYLLEKTVSSMIIGPELTQQLILPEGMSVDAIESTRAQIQEVSDLSNGVSLPVSPRDGHLYHMQVLSGDYDPVNQTWSGAIMGMLSEQNLEGAQTSLQHYQEHFQQAVNLNVLGESQNMAKKFVGDAGNEMQRMIQQLQQLQQEQQEQQGQQQQQQQQQPVV